MNYLNIHNQQEAYMRAAMLEREGYCVIVVPFFMYYQIHYWK